MGKTFTLFEAGCDEEAIDAVTKRSWRLTSSRPDIVYEKTCFLPPQALQIMRLSLEIEALDFRHFHAMNGTEARLGRRLAVCGAVVNEPTWGWSQRPFLAVCVPGREGDWKGMIMCFLVLAVDTISPR